MGYYLYVPYSVSQILALSEVKAIILSGRYATRLDTFLLLLRVACVVIPKFGCPPPWGQYEAGLALPPMQFLNDKKRTWMMNEMAIRTRC